MVSDELSTDDETRQEGCSDGQSSFSFTRVIDDNLPYYLLYGMTYEQYMFGDVELAVYYRKKYELEEQRYNYHAWLQGMYVYEAVADVSPILHAFAKKGTEIIPYAKEPYPITEKQRAEKEARDAKRKHDENLANMRAFMEAFNNQRKDKEVT